MQLQFKWFAPQRVKALFTLLLVYIPAVGLAQTPELHIDPNGTQKGELDFSSDGRFILSSRPTDEPGKWRCDLWDVESGQLSSEQVVAASSSPRITGDGTEIVTMNGKSVAFTDALTGKPIRSIALDETIADVRISPDGRLLAIAGEQGVRVVQLDGGKTIWANQHYSADATLGFSLNSKRLAVVEPHKSIDVVDLDTARSTATLSFPMGEILSRGGSQSLERSFFSPDGKYVFGEVEGGKLAIINLDSKRMMKVDAVHRADNPGESLLQEKTIKSVLSTPDGKNLIVAGQDFVWRMYIRTFDYLEKAADTSKDGTFSWSIDSDDTFISMPGFFFNSARITPDEKHILAVRDDGIVFVFDAYTGKELCRGFNYPDGTFAVVAPNGAYDASNGGDIQGVYWTLGDQRIYLDQIKADYYEPGLLAKCLGFNMDPLRQVPPIESIKLFPKVVTSMSPNGKLAVIKLASQLGGGIGNAQIFVNGALVETVPAVQEGRQDETITLDLTRPDVAKRLLSVGERSSGSTNKIEVVAYNSAGNVSSRSVDLPVPYSKDSSLKPPKLYAIIAGNNYSGSLKLSYAANDASTFASALTQAAKPYFKGGVDIQLLSPANKAGLQSAFEKIANDKDATASSVLVVYLSGHGLGKAGGKAGYFYLTDNPRQTDSASIDEDMSASGYTVSSDELAGWMANIASNKQALILDTCEAGSAFESLGEKKDVPSDLRRAWERLKDRAGVYVLAGCAANQVSFEATNLQHGLLTYSLLEPLNEANPEVLERDGDLLRVDISRWLHNAEDRVPVLTRGLGLGGIQRPELKEKAGAQSFDVGAIASSQRGFLHLSQPVPVLLCGQFADASHLDSKLHLTDTEKKLLSAENDAPSPRFAYWPDVSSQPSAYLVLGDYTVSGNSVTVHVFMQLCDASGEPTPLSDQELGPFPTSDTADIAKAILAAEMAVVNSDWAKKKSPHP